MEEVMSKKSIRLGNKSITYYRPSAARTIPLKRFSNRGVMPSLKPHLKGVVLEYESVLERDFLLLLDHDPNCIDLQTQPIELTYITKTGKEARIYPDCWAIFKNEKQVLFDVKPESQYRKLTKTPNWNLRIKAIQKFCKKMGWVYQVTTEKKIHCLRLNNIKDLILAAKHYSPAKIIKEMGKFDSNLKRILEESPKIFKELVNFLHPLLPLELEEVISLLKYKIYFNHVSIDWDKPIKDTIVSLNGNLPSPIYALEDNFLEVEDRNQVVLIPKEKKSSIISVRDQKKWNQRVELISPIINEYGEEAKKSEILKYCKENGLQFDTTYRWYRIWKKHGNSGLIPKRLTNHLKSHLDQEVEYLLKETIFEWNQGIWTQIKAAYSQFCDKCHDLGLKPATYKTFRLRINALPAVERQGKSKPRTQSSIKRGLSGTYREGRYPGAVIQMDHTLLDIWLVDSFTKQPIGRPWITMGLDVFSRSIWGFYISLDHPSQESVTQAFLTGLISKDQLIDWKIFKSQLMEKGLDPDQYEFVCGGFPALVQVDNSLEFRSKLVRRLCIELNITLEFRRVKTPEYGGFIESVWDTINDGIRNAGLKGRVYSLPKSREVVKRPKFFIPPEYNPKDEACYTLDEFREWFFYYMVVSYSADARARQNHSPNEIWSDGLRGDNHQPMGGALRILDPAEYQRLDFQSKIPVEKTLSQKGLRYKNIYYSSKWLIEARKNRILKDGQRYEFRVSHRDLRWAWIINPVTNEIETLEAYKYDGDDRITDFLRQGLGKNPKFKDFCISLKAIEYVRENLGECEKDSQEMSSVMKSVTEKLAKKGKFNKKERRLFESLSKTREGREELAAAGIIAQFKEGTLPMLNITESTSISNSNEFPILQNEPELDEEIVIPKLSMTSDANKAIKSMVFWDDRMEEN